MAGSTCSLCSTSPIRWSVRSSKRLSMSRRPASPGWRSGALRFKAGEEGREMGEASSLEELIVRHALGMELPTLERESRASGVMMIPVPAAGVLREVRGLAAARAVPLVEDVEITAHPGQTLVPWPEGSRYPGFIFARGGSPDAVEQALRAAHARLEL